MAVARGARQGCVVSGDGRPAWRLIIDVPDGPDTYGRQWAVDRHTGRAAGLIGDLARIDDGMRDAPVGGAGRQCNAVPRARRVRDGGGLMADDRIRELEQRIQELERDTPQARQAQSEADIALADLADSETRDEWLARSNGPEPEYDPDREREAG